MLNSSHSFSYTVVECLYFYTMAMNMKTAQPEQNHSCSASPHRWTKLSSVRFLD